MNLSIWDMNAIHAFRGVSDDAAALDEAEAIYLNGPGDKLRREAVAREWLIVNDRLRPMLAAAAWSYETDETDDGDNRDVTCVSIETARTTAAEVRTFLRDRHFHLRMPGRHAFPAVAQ